ncbi:MAG: hypothetical protein KJ626_01665 [Verrucomicrobia bacterium]|nr:hypothetical protein [Verrucomicrobiota bacterium]
MKKNRLLISTMMVFAVILSALSAMAAPYLQVNGGNGEYATFHYYIDESEGQADIVNIEFWPNEGNVETVELWSNLNKRDFATLYPPDASTVVAGDPNNYYCAYTMNNDNGRYWINMPIEKCGAYRVSVRYKVYGDPNWHWYTGRDTAVVVSDTAARDMIIYEVQANAVDATGNDYNSRSTFDSMHDGYRFNLDYVKALGVNTIWLMPFHPIGSKVDGNYGDVGSPYSIKNMWKVGEHLGSDWNRDDAMHDFQQFVAEAESKGVSIMFDTIFNHTAKDAEIERDPENPYQLAANPGDQIRNVKPNWYSKYTGNGSCFWNDDKGGSPPYEYWAPADNAWQVGPAPADRHDFGKWCDTIDLFWGNYSALGNPQNEDDGMWGASDEVKKLTAYFTYFFQYWLEQTGWAIDGFRCDFAQGLPPAAWEYMINKAKSQKPELVFMAESLDGGAVSRRAGRHFDIINDNWVWDVLEAGNTTPGLRSIIDQRRTDYGYAGLMRGLINHDQSAPADKWYTCSRYAVGCAVDGAPQMFMGQELGYVDGWGFSKFRFEFNRYTPDIRNYYNMEALWNNPAPDKDALWARYAEINHGRMRAFGPRLANQYYLDQVNAYGTHNKIFSVMKYSDFGWDAADQEVVLCFVNLEPGVGHAGTFHIGVPAVYLSPDKHYNVKNLASSNPDAYLWPEARSGSDLAQNGVYIQFPGSVYQEGSVAQFLKLEAVGGGQELWVGNTGNWPWSGELDPGEQLWIDAETWPVRNGQSAVVKYSVNGGAWQSVDAGWFYNDNNSHWHVPIGPFAANDEIEYYIEAHEGSTVKYDTNGGANFKMTVNNGGFPVQWIGGTYNWPWNTINPTDDVWVNIETYPVGAATQATLIYSLDDGASWNSKSMSLAGQNGNNDWWNVNLGTFSSGAHIRYAIFVEDGIGGVHWDSAGGADFHAYVN